ncbi:MAG TPA: YfhO family protein [Thermoanaerobaculia bacterium]|nr:YfhO family protein [Thermoanaerobaculia bacterium]
MSLNPALPLLAGLGVAGLFFGLRAKCRSRGLRREIGLAWGALALAGMALLAPALAIPSGIPSPAASLAEVPPWEGTGSPADGNPVLRDVTFQIQPWQLFARGELRAGRLPFWNPHQFAGAPFWSNGQTAPLFPLHLLFATLPLQLGFVLLPWLRLLIAGCGAWVLGRELGLSQPGALLTALTFSLSGMLVSFLLFPMGNALALVPWVLWAVEQIAAGKGGWSALSLLAGLQLLAGHPETCAHTALLAAIYLLVRRPGALAWGRFALGWIGAALISAIQVLPLLMLLPETSKWAVQGGGGVEPSFTLLLQQPLRIVLPQLYGHPAEGTWWGPFNYSATAVYAGVLVLPLAAAGLARCRDDRRWLGVGVLLAFSFVAAYHWPGIREVLGALPLLGRAAHHRLIFGIELGAALLVGAGCDRWLEGRGKPIAFGAAAGIVLLGIAWVRFSGDWAVRGLTGQQLQWTIGAAVVWLALTGSLLLSRRRRWIVWPLLPAVAICDLLLAHGGILRAIPLERLYPETGAVRFLQAREGRVAGIGQALRPNAALVYGLSDPRGDDPVKLERYEAVYRSFSPGDPVYFQPIERWDSAWLDRLGVRWVVAGPGEPAPRPDWRLAYEGNDARVFERPGALPLVRWTEGGARSVDSLMIVRREPGLWVIEWRSARRARLVIAETWDRGWSARVDGRTVPVMKVNDALLGVELGPGEGTLELRYRPAGFLVGAILSLVGLFVVLVARGRPSPGEGERGGGRGDGGEGSLHIRPTLPEDLPSLSALFADRFGHPLEPDEWRWKYQLLPGEARSYVALEGGEIVAHAGALCLPSRLPEGEAGIWQLVDFVGTTRRAGLRPALVKLGQALLDDLPRPQDAPWIFGFPSERHFRLGQRVFGYRPLLELEIYDGPIPDAPAPPQVRIEMGDAPGDWAARIWARSGVFGVSRSDDFLRWRYWGRPRRYYRFYRLFSNGEEGLAVFAFVGEEAWAAELWLPSSAEWYPSMLAVAADLRASGLRAWRFWPSAGIEPLADSLGLRPAGERRFVGCRGGTPDAGFTYSMGDYDLV